MLSNRDPRQLAADLLDDAAVALRQVGPARFRDSGAPPGSSSIGAHFRHVLDHFSAVEQGVSTGRIDYDDRARDPRTEAELAYALDVSARCRATVLALPDAALDAPVKVQGFCGASREPADSSLRRELGYLYCHTLHHLALIKVVAQAHGVQLPAELGVAPSTLAAQAGRV